MKNYVVKSQVYGFSIQACITKMDHDIHVLLTGGCLPHVGSVSIFKKGRQEGNIQFDGHKDSVVSIRWAKLLSEVFHCNVTIVCGIHYDNVSVSVIDKIVEHTENMLQEAIQSLN